MGADSVSRSKEILSSFETDRDAADSAAPGRMGAPATQTGIDIIDNGPYCSRHPSAPGCFWTDAQRAFVLAERGQRVLAAQTLCQLAVTELKITQLLPSPEEQGLLAGVLIDAVGMILTDGLSAAFLGMQASARATAGDLLRAGASSSLQITARTALQRVSREASARAIELAVGAGKERVKGGVKEDASSFERNAHLASVAFLDVLSMQIGQVFQDIRENGLSSLQNDAELKLDFESWDAKYHTKPGYAVALREKLERYEKSDVANIGTSMNNPDPYAHENIRTQKRLRIAIDPAGHRRGYLVTTSEQTHFGTSAGTISSASSGWLPDDLLEIGEATHMKRYGEPPAVERVPFYLNGNPFAQPPRQP